MHGAAPDGGLFDDATRRIDARARRRSRRPFRDPRFSPSRPTRSSPPPSPRPATKLLHDSRDGQKMAELPRRRAKPKSCADAKELEAPLPRATLTFADGRKSVTLSFAYNACAEEGAQRLYSGVHRTLLLRAGRLRPGDLRTNDGAPSSEVLFSHGNDWIGSFDGQANAALASGAVAAPRRRHAQGRQVRGEGLRDLARRVEAEALSASRRYRQPPRLRISRVAAA